MSRLDSSPPDRRDVMRGAGGFLGLAAGTAGVSGAAAQTAPPPAAIPQPLDAAVKRAEEIRVRVARDNAARPAPPHPTSGDEERYPNRIGSDTRGLPHDARGEVDPAAWRASIAAYTSGDPADFERIPLGGTRRQLNPIGSLAVSLVGPTPSQLAIPPAPVLAGAARAAEAVEIYWQSLLRDVPLSEMQDETSHPLVRAAVDELNKLAEFQGPKVGGRVTPSTLFRGNALYVDAADPSGRTGRWVTPPGVLDGPMVSQFLFRDAPYASQFLPARIRPATPENEFLTEYDEWLAIQNGAAPRRGVRYEATPRYIATGRDLATYAHFLPALSWAAALMLATPAAAGDPSYGGVFPPGTTTLNPTNPYLRSRTQAGGSSTFAAPYFQSLIAQAGSLGIRAAYWQKFYVHRTVRPEAYAGLVHHRLANGVSDYPIHDAILRSEALERSRAKHGTHLLSHVYPEGSPIHSSYPGGATMIGAVGATLLKAFFDEDQIIPNPVQPDPRDPTRLISYAGPPLTVGGELNKMALNYGSGRNWAGIHWRSDFASSMALGEELVIGMLRDERQTYREMFDGFTFTRFDGTKVTV